MGDKTDSPAEAHGEVSIYDGRRFLGTVVPHDDGFDATTANGKALGRFNRQDAAARALFEAGAQ